MQTWWNNLRIQYKIILPALVLSLLSSFATYWYFSRLYRETETNALVTKARTVILASESAREYTADQIRFDVFRDAKQSSMSVEQVLRTVPIFSAMSVAKKKSAELGFTLKVPKFSPRNPDNQPDVYETEVLKKLELGSSSEFWEINNGSIRYFRPIKLTEECMRCHGDPARSQEFWGRSDGKDITGTKMENWRIGEIHGAFEVTMPMESVETAVAQKSLVIAGIAGGSALLMILIMYFVGRFISRSLGSIEIAARKVADGQFENATVQMDSNDEIGSLAGSVNNIVNTIQQFSNEQIIMAQKHTEGMISYYMPAQNFKGKYGELAIGMNTLVKSHIDVKMRVVDVISQYAVGNFAVDMEKLPGEKAKITKSIDDVKANLQSMNKEIAALIDAAQKGNLSVRGDVSKFQYTFREMVGGMNTMLDAIVMPFNEASDALKQMAEGNLSVKMTGQYQGDYAALKNALNTTVDLMPFRECIAILQELSNGNFNVSMQGAYKGDSLDLKNALNKTIDSVSQTLAQVIAVVEQVSLGAQQVATASNDLAQGAQHQAAALEEISSSMTEIGAQTKLNAKGSEQANMLVQESQRTAELGTIEMERLTQAMNAISDGSRNISKIIKVIDEIAFQTNLLALNAAVEAARAGRHGLGFAVVAEEVRNLAARSATAAKETADLIEGSIEKVQNGNALVGKTGEVLHRIAENSTVVAQNVAEIASASKEQSTAIDQINIGLNQIDSVTQQNTANTESSATAAEELSAQARELRALIARFQLSNSHAHIANGFGSVPVSSSPKQGNSTTAKRFPTQESGGGGTGNYTSGSLERHIAALDSNEFDRY